MTSYATAKSLTAKKEELFEKTDADFAKIDTLVNKARKLFDKLTALAENGKKDSEEWAKLWGDYRIAFKKAHGYFPHWAR